MIVGQTGSASSQPLAERIQNVLLQRGRLSARRITAILAEVEPNVPCSRHAVNSLLYKRRDWFRQVPGPFWRPPEWEAVPLEAAVVPAEPPSEPITIGLIEPLPDEVAAERIERRPSPEELALRRERERRRELSIAMPKKALSPPAKEGVHFEHPTHGLPDSFHEWAKGEVTKYDDQDAG